VISSGWENGVRYDAKVTSTPKRFGQADLTTLLNNPLGDTFRFIATGQEGDEACMLTKYEFNAPKPVGEDIIVTPGYVRIPEGDKRLVAFAKKVGWSALMAFLAGLKVTKTRERVVEKQQPCNGTCPPGKDYFPPKPTPPPPCDLPPVPTPAPITKIVDPVIQSAPIKAFFQ
jgi:hypothetical protein